MTDEPMTAAPRSSDADAAPADPNAATTITIGILAAIFVILSIIVLQAVFFRAQDREHRIKVVAETPQELKDLRAAQIEKLQGYRWVDKKEGVAGIPIDRAMEIVVRDAKEGKR